MIKPINISPLNTASELEYKCEKCGEPGTLKINGSPVNVDNNGKPFEPLEDFDCENCNEKLKC